MSRVRSGVCMPVINRLSNVRRFAGFRAVVSGLIVTMAIAPVAAAPANDDPGYRSLFMSWKKLDGLDNKAAGAISIPSIKPVTEMSFSSGFGVRVDPFRRTAAMHPGVDLPGPQGTPIYATADGVVSYAQWMNGYGNLVELDHGKGLATRYGHLSKILVGENQHVHRGDLIALMGSTGRSTGSHLHYEVRIDGRAVNPVPFLENVDYAAAMQKGQPAPGTQAAMGGPDE